MSYGKASKRLGIFLAAAALAGCASSAGPAEAPSPAGGGAALTSTPELIAQGQQIFAGPGRCRVCHGDGGVGGRFGPNLTDDEWAWIDPSSPTAMSDLVERIRQGVSEPRISDSGMPPMGGANLSDEQLQALAAYILSL